MLNIDVHVFPSLVRPPTPEVLHVDFAALLRVFHARRKRATSPMLHMAMSASSCSCLTSLRGVADVQLYEHTVKASRPNHLKLWCLYTQDGPKSEWRTCAAFVAAQLNTPHAARVHWPSVVLLGAA